MTERMIKKNVAWVTKHPKYVLLVALIITIITAFFATQLEMELSWVALAPKGHPAVEEYNRILGAFPSMNNIIVVVEGDDPYEMYQATQALERKMNDLDDYVLSITTGLDQDFMLEYGLLLADEDTQAYMGEALQNPNFEQFLALVYGLIDQTEDDYIKHALELTLTESVEDHLKDVLTGNPLLLDDSGQMTILTIQPSFELMDIEKLEPGVNAIEAVVKEVSDEYDHTLLRATGMHIVGRDETASIKSDSALTSILAVVLIFLMLYFAFRALTAPILTFIPLIVGIIWTIGITYLTVGRLNMITAFSAAMLLGLGIDYAIHMYSSYTERRANGYSKEIAIDHAISISGPGIITGALTTAVAFFALNISQLEMLSELGTVMGIGIISTLTSVFWILPAILILKKEKEEVVKKVQGTYKWIGKVALAASKHKIIVLVLLLMSTSIMIYQSTSVEFDMNLMNLEPEGLESIELMNYMVEEYNMSADSFSVAVKDLEDVYDLQETLEKVDGVKEVVSIATIIPEDLQATEFSPDFVAYSHNDQMIKELLSGLNGSLDEAVILKALDSIDEAYTKAFYTEMKAISAKMLSNPTLTPSDLPDNYKAQFISEDESEYLITIYPDFDIWSNLDTKKGETFFKDLSEVNENITGTPIFMKVLHDSVSDELALIGGILVLILLVILYLHFRSVKYMVYALIPLALTMIFTVGTMSLLGLKFNFLNFLSILMIIGIGIDDGVHILHHHKTGMHKIEYLFSSVGRAILLTTVTTVFGFGSLIFSSYRGIASLGHVLVIGVSYAFIMTVLVLPILLKKE